MKEEKKYILFDTIFFPDDMMPTIDGILADEQSPEQMKEGDIKTLNAIDEILLRNWHDGYLNRTKTKLEILAWHTAERSRIIAEVKKIITEECARVSKEINMPIEVSFEKIDKI